MALAAAGAHALEPRVGVKLRALDKITGNSTDISAKVGETLTFGRLKVTVKACFQAPPEDTPESAAFLEIHATAPAGKGKARYGRRHCAHASRSTAHRPGWPAVLWLDVRVVAGSKRA
jgi:hypothetical protein